MSPLAKIRSGALRRKVTSPPPLPGMVMAPCTPRSCWLEDRSAGELSGTVSAHDQHVIAVGCRAVGYALALHLRPGIKAVGAEGAGSIGEARGAHLQLAVVALVGGGFIIHETEFVQQPSVGRICLGGASAADSADLLPASEAFGQQRRRGCQTMAAYRQEEDKG